MVKNNKQDNISAQKFLTTDKARIKLISTVTLRRTFYFKHIGHYSDEVECFDSGKNLGAGSHEKRNSNNWYLT